MKKFWLFVGVSLVVSFGVSALCAKGDGNPLFIVTIIAGSLVGCSFLFGVVTGDYSWVDRLWSTAPVVFGWIYAARSGLDVRVVAAAIVITLWGIRLTYNFARKGGYSGTEDYRWGILRDRIRNRFAWQLFHLFFICGFQVGMFVLFTSPLDLISQSGARPTVAFVLLLITMSACILIEAVADNQQWDFQQLKRRNDGGNGDPACKMDVERGFLTRGLFSLSRHPNYFGELATWWSLYFLAAVDTGHLLSWAISGPVLLTVLFVGSTRFTESISRAKYPAYADYQRTTSPIIPWFPLRKEDKSGEAQRVQL